MRKTFSIDELLDAFSEIEMHDLKVVRVLMNPTELKSVKRIFIKERHIKLSKELWGATLKGSNNVPLGHVVCTDEKHAEFIFCRIHNKGDEICPECISREVTES